MADYVLHPGEWDNYDVFREKKLNLQQAESSLGFAVSGLESPVYDEAYKLGPKPDLEAFEECAHHLREALAALERVRVSCEGRCTAEYDGHRCEKDNHHEGNHETHEGELLHVWGCVFYTNAEKQG